MLREAEKDPNYVKKEIIDPLDIVKCAYCQKPLSKKDTDCIMIGNGKYVHADCQELEQNREKTDKEQLEEYIKQLFGTTYIDPRVRNQIKKFIDDYNYTYSGIRKALIYHYEIKGGDKSKANGGIGIVPYKYLEAFNYYYALWQAQQTNQDKVISDYVPQIVEVTIPIPAKENKMKRLFSFLDKDEIDGE